MNLSGRERSRLELQTKVGEDFTITEKAPTKTFLKLPDGYDICNCIAISCLLNVFRPGIMGWTDFI